MNMNRVILIGNTGQHAPKTGATQDGKQTTRLTMATNVRFKDDAGNWQSKATWHQIVVFGKNADYAAKIEPGALIFVEGSLSARTYEREIDTPRGPVKVQWPITEIVASAISVVSKRGGMEKEAAA